MLKLFRAAFPGLCGCQTSVFLTGLRDQWEKMPVHICLNSKANCNSSVLVWPAFASWSCSSTEVLLVWIFIRKQSLLLCLLLELFYTILEECPRFLVQSPQIDISGEQTFIFEVPCNWQRPGTLHCQLFQFTTCFSVDKLQSLFPSSTASWHWVAVEVIIWSCVLCCIDH